MKEIELFKHIKDRLGLFVPNSSYDNYVSLIIGYDLAKEHTLLKGFNEWLASKYKLPPNFVFSQQIKYYGIMDKINAILETFLSNGQN